MPIEEILIQIRAQGAITIAAHPVSNHKLEKQTLHLLDKRELYASLFDAWEVGSGVSYYDEVEHSDLPMIASTNLHRFSQISGWKTLVDAPPDSESILEAIWKQKTALFYYKENYDNLPDSFSLKITTSENNNYCRGNGFALAPQGLLRD